MGLNVDTCHKGGWTLFHGPSGAPLRCFIASHRSSWWSIGGFIWRPLCRANQTHREVTTFCQLCVRIDCRIVTAVSCGCDARCLARYRIHETITIRVWWPSCWNVLLLRCWYNCGAFPSYKIRIWGWLVETLKQPYSYNGIPQYSLNCSIPIAVTDLEQKQNSIQVSTYHNTSSDWRHQFCPTYLAHSPWCSVVVRYSLKSRTASDIVHGIIHQWFRHPPSTTWVHLPISSTGTHRVTSVAVVSM